MWNKWLAALALAFVVLLLVAPDPATAQARPIRIDRPLRVFFDCQRGCDFTHIQTEIPYIDYVRDQSDADFHVLVTRQELSGGGAEYTFRLLGLGLFAGTDQIIEYLSDRNNTSEETRRGVARTFQMALMPYVAHTPQAGQIQISNTRPDVGVAPVPSDDPWNLWVLSTRAGGDFEWEEQVDEVSMNAAFSANRTTADWKVNFNLRGSFTDRTFNLSDRVVTSRNENWGGDALLVKSMTGHWSTGALTTIGGSTSTNQKLHTRVAAATEYNIYPYSQSTERQLTLLYSVGVSSYDYIETTVYDQSAEDLLDQALNIAYQIRRPWGYANASLEASHYLHDVSKNRFDLEGNLNFRLFRGLSLNFRGGAVRIRDQLYLPRGKATDEEILTKQRQLATGHEFNASVGFNYAFGSIFNTVVNPRFTGSSRRF